MKKSIKQMQSSLLGLLSVRFLSIQKLLILLVALLVATSAHAYDFEVNGIYYNKLSSTDVAVTFGFSRYTGSIIIPSTVSNNSTTFSVTSIGQFAFRGSTLTSVSIPNSVTSIDEAAFRDCSSLNSVTIPNSVTSIGGGAFYGCSNLTSFTIPSSVTSIGGSAFCGCRSLTSVTIPNSVTSIGYNTFCGCNGLTSVTIPNSVTAIGASAFYGCTSLTSIDIPNSVTAIHSEAFRDCRSLTSLVIPNSVTLIGRSAFCGCSGLISVSISDSVTWISAYAFFDTALYNDDSNWENGVLYIGNHLIKAKSDQVSGDYTIKDGTLTLAGSAFDGCNKLASVVFPNSVISLCDGVFCDCSSLISVIIPNSLSSIESSTFRGCSSLTSVTIPNSVTSIGDNAFNSCTSLTSVTIPNSVTSIGDNAFYDTALFNDDSNWENGVLYIGNHLIKAKSDQVTKDYTIKDGTLTLADGGFYECSGLQSVIIPNSVMSIGGSAFYNCTSMTSVTIPNSATSIGVYAFFGCSGLTSMSIPNTVTSIGNYAFCWCNGITSVNIPNSVVTIGECAFARCTNLTSITVKNSKPSNISLGNDVFSYTPTNSAILYVPTGCQELYANSVQWKDFGSIEELQTAINLIDGQPYSETSDIQDVDVNYTRTFRADIWQPLYVPFNMSYDEWKDYGRVAELSCVHAYEDGRTTIEFVTVNSGELLPNVPYVILPNVDGEVTFTCTNKTLIGAPEEGSKYIMCCSPRYTFKIYGNYQPISGSTLATYGDPQFNGAYVMTTDNKFQHCSSSATLKPYRFYFTKEKTSNGYWGAPARQNAPNMEEDEDVIYLMVDGEVCGIVNVFVDDEVAGKIFDLMGREVKNPTNGIYIQDGKKTHIY